MQILTLNINSIRAHAQCLLSTIRELNPDVILLQELKCTDEQFPHILFEHLGYNIKTFGQKSWNGVAVMSKFSIEDVSRGFPGTEDMGARMIEAVIDGRIRIINVYMPNGESEDSPKFRVKLDWMRAFTKHIAPYLHSEEPVIIAGDINVAIEDRDVWSPEQYRGSSISAEAAREIMREWLGVSPAPLGAGGSRSETGGGWIDCYRHFHPNKNDAWTWIGYRGGSIEKNRGLRLDYFLANHAARPLLKNCDITIVPRTTEKPTDHLGVLLEIK